MPCYIWRKERGEKRKPGDRCGPKFRQTGQFHAQTQQGKDLGPKTPQANRITIHGRRRPQTFLCICTRNLSVIRGRPDPHGSSAETAAWCAAGHPSAVNIRVSPTSLHHLLSCHGSSFRVSLPGLDLSPIQTPEFRYCSWSVSKNTFVVPSPNTSALPSTLRAQLSTSQLLRRTIFHTKLLPCCSVQQSDVAVF